MVAALKNECYQQIRLLCTSEIIYITQLQEEPEKLAGRYLLTCVTLLKGRNRNAWYEQKLAKGELTLEIRDSNKR